MLRSFVLIILTVLSGQIWAYTPTTSGLIYVYDEDRCVYIDQNVGYECQKSNYDIASNFHKAVDDPQIRTTSEKPQTGAFFAFIDGLLVTKSVTVSKGRFPQSAKHIEDAVASGKPNTLTINRAGATANRRDSLRGVKTKPGLDRDEFPPAVFQEGGKGASVRHINRGDNRGAGACIGAQCRGLSDGTRVRIDVVD